MSIQSIIAQKPYLAWYVKDPSQLSDASVVEHILQYGDWNDVTDLFKIRGIEQIAEIFFETTNKKRPNYTPQIQHFFTLYFDKHAK